MKNSNLVSATISGIVCASTSIEITTMGVYLARKSVHGCLTNRIRGGLPDSKILFSNKETIVPSALWGQKKEKLVAP